MVCVCVTMDTAVNHAKTAEPIETPFWVVDLAERSEL